MTEPPTLETLPELLFALLTRGGEGEEQVSLKPPALEKARALIASFPNAQLEAALRDLFRVAYMLDTKLSSPKAARALLMVGLERGGVEVFGGTAVPSARVSEDVWRKLIGGERELPPAGKQKKTGKAPWELIGDPRDDDDEG